MAARFVPLLVLLLVVLLGPASAIPSRCSACKAVATELDTVLANERPRNHIDLRHRLDSKGQREGRVIPYKFSELRVLELLEGLCARVKEYTLSKSGEWTKANKTGDGSEQDQRKADALSKEMNSYCGRLLEKHEDELASTIKSGDLITGFVETVLCEKLTSDCVEREL